MFTLRLTSLRYRSHRTPFLRRVMVWAGEWVEMSQAAQQRVGQYNFLRKLGSGRIAEVYLGRIDGAEGFQKPVAIKKILPQFASDPSLVQALISEAKVGGQLHHRNIVEVYDFIRYGSEYCLIMEYVEGVDLSRILRAARQYRVRIPPAVVLYIASQMCDGLDYAHSARGFSGETLNIIHRDLKPSNILISTKGGVKISDFGIARVLEQALPRMGGTSSPSFLYQSPEQAGGSPRLSPASDVFALGAVFYEMLTLEPLVTWRTPGETPEKLREELPRRLALAQRALPGSDKILVAALHPNPAKRYATAGLMGEDLRRLLVYLKVDDPRERLTHFFWRLVRFIREKSKESPEDGLDGTAPGGGVTAEEAEEWGGMSTRVDSGGPPSVIERTAVAEEEPAEGMVSRTNERVTFTASQDAAFKAVAARPSPLIPPRQVAPEPAPVIVDEPDSEEGEGDPWGDVRTRMIPSGASPNVDPATAIGVAREDTSAAPYSAMGDDGIPYDAPADVTTVRPPTHVAPPQARSPHQDITARPPVEAYPNFSAQTEAPAPTWQTQPEPSPEQTVAVYPPTQQYGAPAPMMAQPQQSSMYETSYQTQPAMAETAMGQLAPAPVMPNLAPPAVTPAPAGRLKKIGALVAALLLVLVGAGVTMTFLKGRNSGAVSAPASQEVLCPDGHPNPATMDGESVKFCGTCGKPLSGGTSAPASP